MKKLLCLFLPLAALLACSSPPPPSFHHYLIQPRLLERLEEEAFFPIDLKVESFSAVGNYGGKRIICRKGPHHVEFYRYHFWSVSPGRMLAEAFATCIRGAGPFRDVLSPMETGAWHMALRGEILNLEEVDEGSTWYGTIGVRVRLEKPDGTVLYRKTFSRKKAAERRNPESVVAALSIAVEEILLELLQDLVTLSDNNFLKRIPKKEDEEEEEEEDKE
jgi:ABC-type uncharacterized transport system auxiliary subunit